MQEASVNHFRFHHLGISVPDLDAAVRWYSDVLGFAFARAIDIPALAARVAVLEREGMHIELFQVDGARAPAENRSDPHGDLTVYGNKHVGFVVDNVPAFAEGLRQRGADVISVNQFRFGCNCFVRDVAGNVLEFVQTR